MAELLKSEPSTQVSHIMVVNLTGFEIHANWIDFNGAFVNYGTIGYRSRKNFKTYVGHPWVFFKTGTQDRMNVIGDPVTGLKDVLMPRPYKPNERQTVRLYVVLRPVYSLKEYCFRVLSYSCHVSKEGALQLQLPNSIVREYIDFIEKVMLPRSET